MPAHTGSGTLQTMILVFVSLALLAGVGATVYFQKFHKPSRGPGDSAAELRDRNLSFDPPPAPWTTDDDTKARLGSPIFLVYKRTDPEAYMAIGVKDFVTRPPRPSELRDGLLRPLGNLFTDVQQKELTGTKWLGQPAYAFEFRARGRQDGPTVAGVCHAVTYKGMAYWSICWAGENDTAGQLPTFQETRGRFKLLGERENWAPLESPVRPFGGHRLPYQVLDAEGIWSEPDRNLQPPEDVDPKADMLLVAREKRRGSDFADEATLVTLILDDESGDPLQAGRTYVVDRLAQKIKGSSPDGAFNAKFTEVTDAPAGDPVQNTVDGLVPVVRLRSTVSGDRNLSRLMVISAIRIGDRVVVASGWCPWADREVFEARLVQIVGSLRPAD